MTPSSANDKGSPNPLTNMDGFGVAWWSNSFESFETGKQGRDGLRPVVYKNIRPPLNDLVLNSLARGVETRAVVAHIRAGTGELFQQLRVASNLPFPLLPFRYLLSCGPWHHSHKWPAYPVPGLTPVVETNCHPYTFGRHVFCHNGVLGSFHLFKAQLLGLLPIRYQLAILGTTDSEHIASLYFFNLFGEKGDWEELYAATQMAEAMRKTIAKLEELKAAAERGGPAEHNALNLLAASGSSLVALRYASPADREAPSLYYSTKAGPTLNRKFKGHPDKAGQEGTGKDKHEHGKHVIIASEPITMDAGDWELIKKGEMVIVEGDIGMKLEPLET